MIVLYFLFLFIFEVFSPAPVGGSGIKLTNVFYGPDDAVSICADEYRNMIVVGSVNMDTSSVFIGKYDEYFNLIWGYAVEFIGLNYYGIDVVCPQFLGYYYVLSRGTGNQELVLLRFRDDGMMDEYLFCEEDHTGVKYLGQKLVWDDFDWEPIVLGVTDRNGPLYNDLPFVARYREYLGYLRDGVAYWYDRKTSDDDHVRGFRSGYSLNFRLAYSTSFFSDGQNPPYIGQGMGFVVAEVDGWNYFPFIDMFHVYGTQGNDVVIDFVEFKWSGYGLLLFETDDPYGPLPYTHMQWVVLDYYDNRFMFYDALSYWNTNLYPAAVACREGYDECVIASYTDTGNIILLKYGIFSHIKWVKKYDFARKVLDMDIDEYDGSIVIIGLDNANDVVVMRLDWEGYGCYWEDCYDCFFGGGSLNWYEYYSYLNFDPLYNYHDFEPWNVHDVKDSIEFEPNDQCTYCYGYWGWEPPTCDFGKGTCNLENDCDCPENWFEDCSITICNGIRTDSGNPNICHGHGSCVSPNQCSCSPPAYYTGNDCEDWECHGVSVHNISQCSKQGQCVGHDDCDCDSGWLGDVCDVTTCGGVLSNVTSNVITYGHLPGSEKFTCFTRGECVSENNCQCFDDVHWDPSTYCEDCRPGWTTDYCNITSCSGIFSNDSTQCSGNGNCVAPEDCECDPEKNYEGYDCHVCQHRWYGPICEVSDCWGILSNDTENVCSNQISGNGISRESNCTGPDQCVCNYKYLGPKCEYNYCFGVGSDIGSVCSGHGECIEYDECFCEDGYYGRDCREMVKLASFTSKIKNRITMDYFLSLETFLDEQNGAYELTEGPFNCSKLGMRAFRSETGDEIRYEDLFMFNTSYCEFTFLEIIEGIEFSEMMTINFIDEEEYDELFGGSDGGDDDDRRSNYFDQLVEVNMTITFLTISKNPQETVYLYIDGYDEVIVPDDDDDDQGELDPLEEYLWAVITFPSSVVGIAAVGVLIILLLAYLCCICIGIFCCCLCCGGFCSCCGLSAQKKKLSKFQELDNFDLLLEEQKLERNSTLPRIKVNKELFEVDASKLKLLSVVGEGGSDAVVYKADWEGRIVAFKCFKTRSVCGNQAVFDEFEREANLLASISHPNIVRFFGCCLKEPRIGFTMEFCSNGDLAQYMLKQKENEAVFLLQEKTRMLLEISFAMSYLHSRKIIHRDLKLENVLLDDSLSCKIMDFGISRMFEQTKQQKTRGIGTSIYISPEIVLGTSYNEKCDVYSYGIMMWILYYENQHPYGANCDFVESKVASSGSFRPSFDSPCPEYLKNLIITCWDHDPGKRKSFREICEYLMKFQKKEAVEGEDQTADGSDGKDKSKKSCFIYIKRKSDGQARAERYFLIYRKYDRLKKMVYEKFCLDEDGAEIEDVRIKKLLLGDVEIVSDQQVEDLISPNCLIDVEFYDERDGTIELLQRENENMMEQIQEMKATIQQLQAMGPPSRARAAPTVPKRKPKKMTLFRRKKRKPPKPPSVPAKGRREKAKSIVEVKNRGARGKAPPPRPKGGLFARFVGGKDESYEEELEEEDLEVEEF